MEIARRTQKNRELDITPLIDIVFLLVIFFMLTTSFITSESIELNLPKASSERTPPPVSAPVRITIGEGGELQYNDTTMDPDAFTDVLLKTLAENPDTPIGIFTSPGVRVQELVDVMDMVYLAGGRKVKVDRVEYAPTPIKEGADAV